VGLTNISLQLLFPVPFGGFDTAPSRVQGFTRSVWNEGAIIDDFSRSRNCNQYHRWAVMKRARFDQAELEVWAKCHRLEILAGAQTVLAKNLNGGWNPNRFQRLTERKGDRPIDRRFQLDSKPIVLRPCFRAEQPISSSSIDGGIRIDSGDPIAQTSERPSTSSKKSSFSNSGPGKWRVKIVRESSCEGDLLPQDFLWRALDLKIRVATNRLRRRSRNDRNDRIAHKCRSSYDATPESRQGPRSY
jgi:hypothetical protein